MRAVGQTVGCSEAAIVDVRFGHMTPWVQVAHKMLVVAPAERSNSGRETESHSWVQEERRMQVRHMVLADVADNFEVDGRSTAGEAGVGSTAVAAGIVRIHWPARAAGCCSSNVVEGAVHRTE